MCEESLLLTLALYHNGMANGVCLNSSDFPRSTVYLLVFYHFGCGEFKFWVLLRVNKTIFFSIWRSLDLEDIFKSDLLFIDAKQKDIIDGSLRWHNEWSLLSSSLHLQHEQNLVFKFKKFRKNINICRSDYYPIDPTICTLLMWIVSFLWLFFIQFLGISLVYHLVENFTFTTKITNWK